MPGIAAHMRFDEKTEFAQAIAQLTGLKPLEDLGRPHFRMRSRVTNPLRPFPEIQEASGRAIA